jgi:hypothetical protein
MFAPVPDLAMGTQKRASHNGSTLSLRQSNFELAQAQTVPPEVGSSQSGKLYGNSTGRGRAFDPAVFSANSIFCTGFLEIRQIPEVSKPQLWL